MKFHLHVIAFTSDQFLYNYNFGTLVRKEQTKVFQSCLTTNHYYQKPQIEEGQTIQLLKEKGQKDKQSLKIPQG
jgi:hypothetical protein